MSSRTKRFLPKKIKRSAHQPITKPEAFESVIREAFDFTRKISRKRAGGDKADDYLSYVYQGQIEKYRKEVLRRTLPDMMKRLQERCSGQMDLNDALLSWIELNAPMASYTKMEQESHVLFAAAIWMLDCITEQKNWRRKLFPLLPRNDHETEEFFEPDFWDCRYEYDLVASVVNVLNYRNLNVNHAGKKTGSIDASAIDNFDERLQLYENNPYVLTSDYAATHELDEDWRDKPEKDSNRERFRALLALIPQEDIDEAAEQFRTLWSQWIDLFYSGVTAIHSGQDSINDRKEKIAEEHNAIVDELEMLIDSVEEQRRAKTVRKDKREAAPAGSAKGSSPVNAPASQSARPPANPLINPLMNPLAANPALGKLPNIEQFIKSQTAGGPGVNRGLSSAMSATAAVSSAIHSATGPDRFFPGMGVMTGDADMDAKINRINNLYMRCNDLEERYDELTDDLNTLYRKERAYSLQMASYGRISNGFKEYLAGLPSAVQEPMRFSDVFGLCFAFLYLIETRDDTVWLYGAGHGLMAQVCESLPWGIREYDEIGDPVWEHEDYEHEDVPKTARIPDWYERKYAEKDSDYYFPRSLAQVLYEETGCILPRDVSLYYPEYETIRDYGIRGKDAGVMMLMSLALSTARRRVKANNFDAEYLRFLENDPSDPPDKDESEEDEGNSEQEEAAVPDTPPDESKDEKDLLIDQLREELKKARASTHAAEAETRNIRKELASTKIIYEREHRELADLREIVFSQQFADEAGEPEQPSTGSEKTYPYETTKRTTVFGGHETFLKAIKPMLPNVRFIDSRYMTFSPELVRNSDIVWIQSNCISHPMFWSAVKYAKQYGVQIRYLGYASAEKCADQIVEADNR